jgi:hypothetical protein
MAIILLTTTGNQEPNFQITLQRDGTAIDLTNCTVKLIIKNAKTGLITNTSQSCIIVTAASGIIQYAPSANDFTEAGRYFGEIQITSDNGQVEKMYEQILIISRAAIS